MENLPADSESTQLPWLRTGFLEKNYPRLSEAAYRLAVEPPDHTFRDVAAVEIKRLRDEALALGFTEEEFLSLCQTTFNKPWKDEKDRTYIETNEGHRDYFLGYGSIGPVMESDWARLEDYAEKVQNFLNAA